MSEPIATFITPAKSLGQAVERVRLAEQLGYEAVFSTHIAARDGLMTLAAYAAGTERIRLGTGVIPAFPRHPVALATEAATLDEMSGGRLLLGIGTSHAITMQNWYGFAFDKPLSQLKEYVSILRSILRTGSVQHEGAYYRTTFAFMGYAARPDLPIYLSGLSPNTLRFAGEAADGIVLWACMPSYIRDTVVPAIREGEKAAGRDEGSCRIVAAVPCALATDLDVARDSFRRDFFVYMTLPFYRKVIGAAGYTDELARFDEALGKGDADGARAAISDGMLAEFAGIGDASAVKGKVAEYRAAGVDLPAVGSFSMPREAGPGVDATLEAAAS